MVNEQIKFLQQGSIDLYGLPRLYLKKANEKYLKNETLWNNFVSVFRTHEDDVDCGWRGEYWGKTMRGACVCYYYNNDKSLYNVLEKSVTDLLDAQDELGRISSYSVEKEFSGWDLWSRKYVITGLLHFIDISENENLIRRIYRALEKHVGYIIEKIGNKDGQKDILQTSSIWGCVNSCTLLEPILDLYVRTNDKRYLDFAEYVISTGGSNLGSIIQAIDNEVVPSKWPVTKSYEVLSFVEGLLLYYRITDKEYYLQITEKCVRLVKEHEMSIAGGIGYLSEEFDDAGRKQTDCAPYPTQETCVTVTYVRLLAKLYLLTNKTEYFDVIELCIKNNFYGSVNIHNLMQHTGVACGKKSVGRFMFDSYSPVTDGMRDVGVGGLKQIGGGIYNGCCASIGFVCLALYPLLQAVEVNGVLTLNDYYAGKMNYNGCTVEISSLKSKNAVKIRFDGTLENINLKLPIWSDNTVVLLNGEKQTPNSRYCNISATLGEKDEIVMVFDCAVKVKKLNDSIAFTYGPYVLTQDSKKGKPQSVADISLDTNDFGCRILKPEKYESVRLILYDEKNRVLFTDYSSCGKKWKKADDKISCWYKIKGV